MTQQQYKLEPLAASGVTQPKTLAEMIVRATATFSDVALKYKEGDQWKDISYPELGRRIRSVAKGLMALGVGRGGRIAILADTRPEWTIIDFAGLSIGAAVVPVYQTNSPGECEHVLGHSETTVVFCENDKQLAKIDQIKSKLPQLRQVVMIEGEGNVEAMPLAQLEALGKEIDDEQFYAAVQQVQPDDIGTLIYTSGTTGPPKGCILTHANLECTRQMLNPAIKDVGSGDIFYAFLPLAHVLTRMLEVFALGAGATLAFWQRDPKKIVEDIQEVQPTHLPAVPRIFEKIYTAATSHSTGAKGKILDWSIDVGGRVLETLRAGKRPGFLLTMQYAAAERLALSKVRALFGGRLKLAVTGAAPISPDILRFFAACGVPVFEGYGMTETTAIIAINTPEELKFGTVGKPLPGVEVKIADDGEILVHGANVFHGYFNDEASTKETLKKGWLCSGDLGSLDEEGFLSITGRKKDLIITSSGKNITPSNIENGLNQSRFISQAVVYGDRRPYLVALVTLDGDELPGLASQCGVAADMTAMAQDGRVRDEIQRAIDEVNASFARIEQVKRFEILGHSFTQEQGELTPTLKLKRNVVYERYADHFGQLYDNGQQPA